MIKFKFVMLSISFDSDLSASSNIIELELGQFEKQPSQALKMQQHTSNLNTLKKSEMNEPSVIDK